jgi:taurine--2-oxoglutarate transaminase
MKRLKLNERATEMGAYLGEKLMALKPRHRSIGDVRGIGMFWAVDLVKNQQKKNPFNTGEEKLAGKPLVVDRIAAKMMGNGVFIQAWMSHFVIAPPLIISKDEIDRGVAALDEALALADAEVEA